MEESFSSDTVFHSLKDRRPGLNHDSGYEELLHSSKVETLESKFDMGKSFSFDCLHLCAVSSKEKLPQSHALIDSPSSTSTTPKKDRLRAKDPQRSPMKDAKKENAFSSACCETPKTYKKDSSLRRRLILSRSRTDEKQGNSKASNSRLNSFDAPSLEDDSSGSFDSPDTRLFEALVTSTLKNDEVSSSCRKRRLVFSQVKTSTLEDWNNKAPQPSTSGAGVTEHLTTQGDLNETIISSFPHHLAPEFLETPRQSKFTPSAKENFQTPARDIATNLCNELGILSTPSLTPISKLDTSVSEDSGFSSLGLDKFQDSSVDYDPSVQEFSLQLATCKDGETPRAAEARRRYRLERQRRLSTLKEGGSLSEEEGRPVESVCSHGKLLPRGQKALATEEEDEPFLEKTPLGRTTVKLEDLSLTPALQLVQAMCQRNARMLPEQTSLEGLLNACESFNTTLPLAGLIGRKMGLKKLDILSELKKRNLRHILAVILNLLSSEDIYSFVQVSNVWDEIVLQDKMTNRRRRSYFKDLKMAHALGADAAHVPDAETRLNLQCRSALKSAQAQAKTPVTRTPILGNGTFTPVQHKVHSASKQDEFLQVAKTLFIDECLKPCPRCQHPARCHSVKREGVCSREDCGFRFCTSCMCAYHGSKECGSWSAKRRGKKDVLPGSAQSKRNLRRL